jgi:cation diffusion facilitator CzcD-associated flavoprotein CzcO
LTGVVVFSEEQIRRWKEHPDVFEKFHRDIEYEQHLSFQALLIGSEDQKGGQAFFSEMMKKRLASRPDIYEELLPSFPPGCRLLTPGPGYLEALVQPNVDFIKTKIKQIHPGGIETEDGTFRKCDVIVCATGFNVSGQKYIPSLVAMALKSIRNGRIDQLLTTRLLSRSFLIVSLLVAQIWL